MPTTSRFYGMLIQMYHDDHNPADFHAIYGDCRAVISIQDLDILEGDLPPKAAGPVMEWGRTHRDDLLKDWDLAREKKFLFPIEPLE